MAECVLPDGSLFDFNVGLGNDLPTAPFHGYERLLESTKSRLNKYGRGPKKLEAFQSISAEVGDDELSVDSQPEYAACKCAVYSDLLGMKISEEDTSINPRFGNYAEDLFMVPDGYEQTYRYAQQTSDFKNMAFLDVPKLRLAIDIRPGRMTHSSTNDGKAGMLGSRLAWLPGDSPVRMTWEVFNLYQDINLGFIRDDKFAYLPTALGGYGKPIPFSNPENFERFLKCYKQGTHSGLARELVRRTNIRFSEYTQENRYHEDVVLSAVSRLQSSWHDWIKGKSLYAPTCWLEAPPEVVNLRVGTQGRDTVWDGATRRLQASGYLITENDLAIAYEHNKLCEYLVGTETHEEFLKGREEARSSWLNLSTFSMRLYGLLTPLGVDVSLHSPLRPEEYQEFWFNVTKSRLHLRSFLRQENLYDAKAKDLVYNIGPMMVKVPLAPKVTQMGRRYWYEYTLDTKNSLETTEEFNKLYDWVKNPSEGLPPQTLIEDDPVILRDIKSRAFDVGHCIVTEDKALCRQALKETKSWVVRVPVKWYYMAMYYQDDPEPWIKVLSTKYPMYKWVTYLDQGSIESYEEIGFRDGQPLNWRAVRKLHMTKPSMRGAVRIREQRTFPSIETDEQWKPYRFPENYIYSSDLIYKRLKRSFKY